MATTILNAVDGRSSELWLNTGTGGQTKTCVYLVLCDDAYQLLSSGTRDLDRCAAQGGAPLSDRDNMSNHQVYLQGSRNSFNRSCSNWTCQSTSCGVLGTFVVTSVLKHKDIRAIHERARRPVPDGAPFAPNMPRTAQSGCMLMQSIYDLIDKPRTGLRELRVHLVHGHDYLVDAADLLKSSLTSVLK